MSDFYLFSDEDVFAGSDEIKDPGSMNLDQSVESISGSKKKKKKKKKKKRKLEKERRLNSGDEGSLSTEAPETLGNKESSGRCPVISSPLVSPELKRKISKRGTEPNLKRSKVQTQLDNLGSDPETPIFSKEPDHQSRFFKDKPLLTSPKASNSRFKDMKRRVHDKSNPIKPSYFERRKTGEEIKISKKESTTPETSKFTPNNQNHNELKPLRKPNPPTISNTLELETQPEQTKSIFSKSTKLVKVLAVDTRKDNLTRENSKDKKSSNGTPSEVEAEVSTIPRHLPPKHNDAPNAPFPWINMYPDRPNPKAGVPMQVNGSKYFTAPEVTIYSDCLTVKNDGNYRVALANYGVATGTFYYEIKIASRPKDSNLRVGVAQLNVAKQAPLGFDGFGYAFRTDPPTLFHRSRPYDVDIAGQEGDVIGVLLHLPPLVEPEQKEINFRVWNKKYVYAQFSYEQNPLLPSILKPIDVPCGPGGRSLSSPVPQPEQKPYPFPDPHKRFDQLPLQSGSQLVYFVNGQQVGLPFSNLILAKYYPAVSIYRGAKLQLNFGPDFEFPPPKVWYPRFPLHSGSIGFFPISQPVQPFSQLVPFHSPLDS